MGGFYNMLNSQLVLLCYIMVGIYCEKKYLIDETTKKNLVNLILKITLPCMIFNSFNESLTLQTLKNTAWIFLVSLLIAFLSWVIGKVAYNRYPPEKKSILQYSTLVNNAGFLGMPLVHAVFGAEGLLYASIFVIPTRILMWTAGISLFTTADCKTQVKNILLNPCIVTVYLGLARRLLNIPLPVFLDTAVAKIGNVTSPLSMMVIGTMLVGITWKSLLEPAIFYLSAIRLVLLPLVAVLITRSFHFTSLLTGVSLVMTGMPAGSTGALLAAKYGANEEFASRCVATTTVLSLLTASLLMFLI